jgi:uncharacterized protein DUF1707
MSGMLPENELRASDQERDAVVALLGDHLAEGRIDLAEFEERSTRAGAARTRGELAQLTEDLPSARPVPAPAPAAAPTPQPEPEHEHEHEPAVSLTKDPAPVRRTGAAVVLRPVARWLSVSVICVTIWAVSSLMSGTAQHFWPGWVIGGWGAMTLLRVLKSDAEHD